MPHTPFVFRRRAVLLRAAAVTALVLGYSDLVRGGITIAPVMLVVGYGLLVPLAVLEP